MSATRPATEFSIGIMPSSASPEEIAASASSKVAHGNGSASGYASTMGIWELAPGSPWNAIFSFLVMAGLLAAGQALAIAFSSEVEAGSREENASKQKGRASFNLNEAPVSGGRFRGRRGGRRRGGRC